MESPSPPPPSSSFVVSMTPFASLAVLLYALYYFLFHPLFLSPLARIPNAHWSSALSSLWILYVRRSSRENTVLLEAHKRLGPIVRVGPYDVSINNADYVKAVYGGGFDRTEWYGVFDNYGVPCMFSARAGREHSLRKRMISHVYSKSFIHSSPVVAGHTKTILLDRLRPILEASAAPDQVPAGINVMPLFFATSMDAISAHVFGLHGGTNFLRRSAYRDHWLELYLSRHGSPFFPQELPRLTRFMRRCGFSLYPRWVDWANVELAAWNQKLCEASEAFLKQKKMDGEATTMHRDNQEDAPLVMEALLAGLHREESANGTASLLYDTAIRQQKLTVQSELFDHVLAGHETTGIALTYLAWQLSRNQEAQRRLQEELFQLGGTGAGAPDAFYPDANKLDSLPVLHAIVMETLRLHAPIPGPQPRQTPSSGCQIGPYELPGGVRIAALAYALHRDRKIFSDPETWEYTRWLDTGNAAQSAETRRAQARQFWAFGSGGRMCIGSHFAMHEMKAVTAMIYSHFTTHIVDDSGMEQTDSYTSRPAGEQLYLRFEPLKRV